ncbi:type VII secretion target [Actinoalloteichus spitiensis]|uniref:type VII secretion target n=1 Tax=Actinoalloteichus spitiensis TaxID=252394 RepID=UPI00037619C7|nr:type VII secretion target [Actinoalloteichus spitiensis]
MDGFHVYPEQMRQHAARLDGVVQQIGVAQDAATHASISGTTAYGLLCSPIMLPLMGGIEALGHGAIAAAGGTVGATSTAITASADTYELLEEGVSRLFAQIAERLEGPSSP